MLILALYILSVLFLLMCLFLQIVSSRLPYIIAALLVHVLTSSLRSLLLVMLIYSYLRFITCFVVWLFTASLLLLGRQVFWFIVNNVVLSVEFFCGVLKSVLKLLQYYLVSLVPDLFFSLQSVSPFSCFNFFSALRPHQIKEDWYGTVSLSYSCLDIYFLM